MGTVCPALFHTKSTVTDTTLSQRSLELSSPHIMKDDVELWLEFIKRDIPKWEEYELPEDPDSWYDIYCELLERVRRSVEEDAERLKMALDGINSERAKHSAKFVTDRRSIPLPRERPTAKQRYASYDRKMGGISPVFVSATQSGTSTANQLGAPAWTFERPQLPRPDFATTRKRNSIFNTTKRNPALAVPTNRLNSKATQVKQAPLSLIEDHRRPTEPALASTHKGPPTLIAPGRSRPKSTTGSGPSSVPITPSLQEKEARLRALTSNHRPAPKQPKFSSPVGSPPSSKGRSPPRSSSPLKGSALFATTQRPSKQSPAGSIPQNPSIMPRNEPYKTEYSPSGESSNNAVPKEPPEAAPRPMIMRKRPPSSVFIQPKKKKV